MEQTASPPAAPAPAEGTKGPLDVKQLKSMLNLPETASDIEIITALIEMIGGLQQKYDALLSDAVTLEDTVANRDVEDFKDVIAPETKLFWKDRLLTNRDEALGILSGIRAGRQAASPAKLEERSREPLREPLRNRLVDQPRSVAELAGQPPAAAQSRAVAIRNRARELTKIEKMPWGEAFARAEKETAQ